MLALLFLAGTTVLFGGYVVFGRILDRKFNASGAHPTPATTEYDGVDFVPTRTPILFVQDVSGFMVGPEAEHSGIIRAGRPGIFISRSVMTRGIKVRMTLPKLPHDNRMSPFS